MANKKINTAELDFDAIKANLKQYLQGQNEFSDYDFEGSGLDIILDVLAYNTHYNMLYNNMAVNESFIDTATKRSSVVSKAKELGYVASSSVCAKATVSVVVTPTGDNPPLFLELPRHTPFTTNVNDNSYTFYSSSTYVAYLADGVYSFPSVIVQEGYPLSYNYQVGTTRTKYTIPNYNVDTNTIEVQVQASSQDTSSVSYSRADSIIGVDNESTIFYIGENDNNQYDLEFGDGSLGKALVAGNIVNVEYFTCNQDKPNGARVFEFGGSTGIASVVSVSTVSVASGGAQPEDIERIRWNAPRRFESQNRCVSIADYTSTIYSLYPNARTVAAWGGEHHQPPVYGKVFISIALDDGYSISEESKSYILNSIIGPRKVSTVTPVFVDPTYLRVGASIKFYYNPTKTNKTATELAAMVRQTVARYNDNTLGEFKGELKYSVLSSLIDNTETAIINNDVELIMHKDIEPIFNTNVRYNIDIGNAIDKGSISSTGIVIAGLNDTCYLEDVSDASDEGIIRAYYISSGTRMLFNNVGTVNYSTGIIDLTSLNITSVAENMVISMRPISNNIQSVRNQIVKIDTSLIDITPVITTAVSSYSFNVAG